MIKVGDFGLSESTYSKNYFRQDQSAGIKLPIKWMAPESLTDGIFSEKTDVVSTMPHPYILFAVTRDRVGMGEGCRVGEGCWKGVEGGEEVGRGVGEGEEGKEHFAGYTVSKL